MATPTTQPLSASLQVVSYSAGSKVLGVVKDVAGAAIDISAWTFRIQYRPSNPNWIASPATPSGMTFTGDSSGNLTATWTGAFANNLSSNSGSYSAQGSNDSFATLTNLATGSVNVQNV